MSARTAVGTWGIWTTLLVLAHTGCAAPATPTASDPLHGDPAVLRANVACQIALERACFSPGVIDGKIGPKTLLALREFVAGQTQAGVIPPPLVAPPAGAVGAEKDKPQPRAFAPQTPGNKPQSKEGLSESAAKEGRSAGAPAPVAPEALGVNAAEAFREYVVDQADAAAVTGAFKTWLEKSQARRLGYPTLAQAVEERFHCSEALLAALNGQVKLEEIKVGDKLIVPAVASSEGPQVERLQINFTEKVLRCFNKEGGLVALFHCSIARDPARRPEGSAKVVGVTNSPEYLFDPVLWPEVTDVKGKLVIPPGPRNPVGLCWVGLDRPGYGIHGTPNPEMIGKTGSHGCFRLTNWDAVRLGKMVRPGVPVEFVKE